MNDFAALLTDHGVTLPPTQDELPYDDGEPLETSRHRVQMNLLIDTLDPWLSRRGNGFAGGNMFVYFSMEQTRGRHFRGPDVFVVLDVPSHERKSWVVWEEGKGPDVVIELLSESTAEVDKGSKKIIYQNELRVPEYFWYDPFDSEDWAGFALREGVYEPLQPDAAGRFISQALALALVRWTGVYKGVETTWLRWATLAGDLLLTDEEQAVQRLEDERQQVQQERARAEQERARAEQECARAEQERARAEQECARAERLAARLRELGIEPEE